MQFLGKSLRNVRKQRYQACNSQSENLQGIPVIVQRKLLCRAYLNKICGSGWKHNLLM